MRTLRNLSTSVTAALVLLLCACTSSVDGTTASGTAAPGTDRLADALSLVPAVAGSAEVLDLAAAKQRWGLSDVTSQTDPDSDPAAQLRKKFAASGLGSRLLNYSVPMADAGWNGLDVDIEVTPRVDGPPVTIYRLRSSLDMQQVIDSFQEDGMKRSGADDAPFFKSADLGSGTFGPVFLSGVTVYPAQHLLVAGPEGSWNPPAPASSLAQDPTVSALTVDLGAVDWVAVTTGGRACVPVDLASQMMNPGAAQKYVATLDAAGERKPVTSSVVAVTGDDTGQIRTGYTDAAAAAADLPVRTKILQTVRSLAVNQPYSQLFTATIKADGPTLRYDLSMQRPSILIRALQQHDAPWAFC